MKLLITTEAAEALKGLMTKESLATFQRRKIDARTYRESAFPFQGLVLMYGSTLAHVIPGKDVVISITHQEITDSFKAMFDALFVSGTPWSFVNTA